MQNDKKQNNMKAQMEIMGLAIIIILIILAILFSLHFLPQNKISERAIQDSLVANMFVNTLLETTIKDCNIKLKELIRNCAQGNSLPCTHGSTTCQMSKDIITQLTNVYFEKTKRSYNLFIQGNSDITPLTILAECKGERESSKPFIIPSRAGTSITVRLEVCS